MFTVDNVKDIVALNKDFATLEFIENPVWWPTRTGVPAIKGLLYERTSIEQKIDADDLFFVLLDNVCLCPLTRQPLNIREALDATDFRDILVCATRNAIEASKTIDRNNSHIREFEELERFVNLPQRDNFTYQRRIKELFEADEDNLEEIERIALNILKLHNLVNKDTLLIAIRNDFLVSFEEFLEEDTQSIEDIDNEELRSEARIYLNNIKSLEGVIKSLKVDSEELLQMNIASAERLISINRKKIERVIVKDDILSQIDDMIAVETQLTHANNQMKAEVNICINNMKNIKTIIQNLTVGSPETFDLNLQEEKRMLANNYARLLEIDRRHAIIKETFDWEVNNQVLTHSMFDVQCQLEANICLSNLRNIRQVVYRLNTEPKKIYEMNINDAQRMINELTQKLASLIEKDKVLKEMNNVIKMMQALIVKAQHYIESDPPEHEVVRANIFIANINNVIHFAKINMNNGFETATGNVCSLLRMNLVDIKWMDGFVVRINARKSMNEVIIKVSNLIQKARCFIATNPTQDLRAKAECLIKNLNSIIKIAEANKYIYPEVAKLNIDSILKLNAESMIWMEGINIQMTAPIAMQVIKTEAELFISKTGAFLRTRPDNQDIVKANSLILNLKNIIYLATINSSNSYEIAMANMKSVIDMQVEAIDWMQEQQLYTTTFNGFNVFTPAYQELDFGVSSRVLMFSDSLKNRKRSNEPPLVTLETRTFTYPF